MKKTFVGVSYLILITLAFTYYLVPVVSQGDNYEFRTLLTEVSYTGVSVIGWIFLIPTFVFAIIGLIKSSPKLDFLRDMFALFSAVFTAGTILIATFIYHSIRWYVVIILIICVIGLLAFSIYGVVSGLINEKRAKQAKADAE